MNLGQIIGLIIGIVVVVAALSVTLYFTVIRKNQARKKWRNLSKKFERSFALLLGEISQYVKRLENISRLNLLYLDIHTKCLRKLKELREVAAENTGKAISNLKDYVDANDFKKFKANITETTNKTHAFITSVDNFLTELKTILKREEECREAALESKEKLRNIRQKYSSSETELSIMKDSFVSVIDFVNSQFTVYEDCVECANYDEADQILPQINGLLDEINNIMPVLPNLCTLATVVVPEKIDSLNSAYKLMIEDRFPLHNLGVSNKIEQMNATVAKDVELIKKFKINGIQESFDSMIATVDDLLNKFEEEKKAREVFNLNYKTIYSSVNLVERDFIALKNDIPLVEERFIINEEHKTRINTIQKDVNRAGALKRVLDTFIHSNTKQPFTILMGKMNELNDATVLAGNEIKEYRTYLSSLDEDAVSANKVIFDYYSKVKQAEQYVREINTESINGKYKPKFDAIYTLLNEISCLLDSKPINIEKINEIVNRLKSIGNQILDKGEIYQDYNTMILAETTILYANRQRNNFANVESQIKQAEGFFRKGEFQQSHLIAGNALNSIKEQNNAK